MATNKTDGRKICSSFCLQLFFSFLSFFNWALKSAGAGSNAVPCVRQRVTFSRAGHFNCKNIWGGRGGVRGGHVNVYFAQDIQIAFNYIILKYITLYFITCPSALAELELIESLQVYLRQYPLHRVR